MTPPHSTGRFLNKNYEFKVRLLFFANWESCFFCLDGIRLSLDLSPQFSWIKWLNWFSGWSLLVQLNFWMEKFVTDSLIPGWLNVTKELENGRTEVFWKTWDDAQQDFLTKLTFISEALVGWLVGWYCSTWPRCWRVTIASAAAAAINLTFVQRFWLDSVQRFCQGWVAEKGEPGIASVFFHLFSSPPGHWTRMSRPPPPPPSSRLT